MAFIPGYTGIFRALDLVAVLTVLTVSDYSEILSAIVETIAVDMINFHALRGIHDNTMHTEEGFVVGLLGDSVANGIEYAGGFVFFQSMPFVTG